MLTFLRKFRKRLLAENRFSKYLLYAFGEIVLVVLGILIALQINNWNEERKDNLRESKLKSELIEEFEKDLAQLESKITIRNRMIQSCIKVLGYMDGDAIPDSDSIKYHLTYTSYRPTFDPISVEVIDKSDLGLIRNDSLRRLLTAWKIEVLQLREDELNWQRYVIEHKYPYELHSAPGLARSLQVEFWKDQQASLYLLENEGVNRTNLKALNTEMDYPEIIKSPFWDTYCTRAIQLNEDANHNSHVLKNRIHQMIQLLSE